jgi:hypothetical protein
MTSPSTFYGLIPLTRGQHAKVDAEDWARIALFQWQTRGEPNRWYAMRTDRSCGRDRNMKMHRLVLGVDQYDQSFHIDHINGDRLDNRSGNLRVVLPSQNAMNLKLRYNSTTGYKGVSFRKDMGVWQARITVANRTMSLGMFETAELAYAAYCEAALKYHGEFAREAV